MKAQDKDMVEEEEREDRKENLWGEDYHGRLSREDVAKMDDGELRDGMGWHCSALKEHMNLLADLADGGAESPALGMFSFLFVEAERRSNIIDAYADELCERLAQARRVKAA